MKPSPAGTTWVGDVSVRSSKYTVNTAENVMRWDEKLFEIV